MWTYKPFSEEQWTQLRGLLARGATSLSAFSMLRQELTGAALALDGLRMLTESEPTLTARLAERIFPSILSHAQRLLTDRPPELATHRAGRSALTRIPRADVAGWLAHMFLGTIKPPFPDFPQLDFAPLLLAPWPSELAKLRCVLAYFDRIADATPTGFLEIERLVTPLRTSAEWVADRSQLLPFEVHARGGIEDAQGCLQVDFANRYLGGGILTGGCVQEEIRFAVAPELLVGMLVSPYMRDEEAIVLRGSERFAETRGYARSLEYAGPFLDPCKRKADGTPDVELLAIDAVDYRRRDAATQYTDAHILRELGKARCGFKNDPRALPVATGNWGCGAFAGDPALKAVIQWLAASSEGRALRYFPFGDVRVGNLEGFASEARRRRMTVGALAQRLFRVGAQGGGSALYARLLSD